MFYNHIFGFVLTSFDKIVPVWVDFWRKLWKEMLRNSDDTKTKCLCLYRWTYAKRSLLSKNQEYVKKKSRPLRSGSSRNQDFQYYLYKITFLLLSTVKSPHSSLMYWSPTTMAAGRFFLTVTFTFSE